MENIKNEKQKLKFIWSPICALAKTMGEERRKQEEEEEEGEGEGDQNQGMFSS